MTAEAIRRVLSQRRPGDLFLIVAALFLLIVGGAMLAPPVLAGLAPAFAEWSAASWAVLIVTAGIMLALAWRAGLPVWRILAVLMILAVGAALWPR